MGPNALSLDLFGTIVFFDIERLPRRLVGNEPKIVTVAGIDDLLADFAPGTTLEAFHEALVRASADIARAKITDRREIPTGERFRRALVASGVEGTRAEVAAAMMAERHMSTLAAAVICPSDRISVLEQLAARYPLALVSNFDHGPTAHALLERFQLKDYFKTVVVSADVGFLKPAVEIFATACKRLAVGPARCLHVGDSKEADVEGATAAGMAAVWVGTGDAAPATGCISDLRELPEWLAERYG